MTLPNSSSPLRSLGGSTVFAMAAFAVVTLGASCGAGLVGGAGAASSSGGSSTPEGAQLDVEGSFPVLSLTQFQEPTRANEEIPGAVPAEPSDRLTLEFSGPIESSLPSDAIRVEIKRPGGDFMPVDVVEVRAVTSRSLEVRLDGDTLHNSLYRVSINGVSSSNSPVLVPNTDAFFVVRDGEWKTPEFITTSNGGQSGGVTIAGELDHYATLEDFFDIENSSDPDAMAWNVSTISSEFGTPWEVADLIYARQAEGADEHDLQPQTSPLVVFDEVGLIRVHESTFNGPQSQNKSSYLRAAVGLYLNDTFPEEVRGFQSGPPVTVTSRNDPTGLVDRPGAAFGPGTDHFSFNGAFAADGRSVAASFWALTELDGTNQYTTAKVYSNTALAAPFSGSTDAIDWAGWDPAAELSDPGEDFNSWPLLHQLPGGGAAAMWWSSDSLQGVLEGNALKYWLSTWSAMGGWTSAIEVSPSGMTSPSMGMITDLQSVVGTNGDELLVFTRTATGPAVAHLDLATFTWGQQFSPAGATSIPTTPSFAEFSAAAASGNYRSQLSKIRRTTPQATSIGNGEFIVRWIDSQAGSQSGLFASIYKPSGPIGPEWDAPVDLSSFAVIDPTNPERAVDLVVDTNGWATLIYQQRQDLMSPTSPFQLFARRANLVVNGAGASAFAASEEVQISTPDLEISVPAASNVHASGAFSVVWQYQPQGSPGGGGGNALSRFQ